MLEFRRGTSTSYENHTVLARVGYTNSINVDHSIGSDDKDGTYIIKVSIGASDTGAYIYQGARGSAYSGARIKEVIGIKLTKNLDNATSLDETLLYSGNDYINDITGFREYTLADMADNYDYLLVRSSAVTTDNGNVISTYTIISPPFIDNVNEMISFNFYYESQNAYDISVQNLFYFSGWFRLDGTKLFRVGLRGLGSRVGNFYVEKVIGIKKNSLSTSDIAELSMPSDVYVNLDRGTASSVAFIYTAPANGWICWMDNPYSSNSFMRIECKHNDIYKTGNTHYGKLNTDCIVTCPITKGDTVGFYGGGLTYNAYSTIRFFYSVGDAKALGLI